MKRAWSERDLRILQEEYPTVEDTKEFSKRLGRTWDTVKVKAHLLGLKRQVKKVRHAPEKKKKIERQLVKDKRPNGRRMEDQVRKFRLPDLSGKVAVRLDHKTFVYLKPGADLNRVRQVYGL